MKNSVVSILLSFVGAQALAAGAFTDGLDFKFASPAGRAELCRVPRKIAGPLASQSKFSADDADDEALLCGVDFYRSYGVCPKLNSTNPGVLVSTLPQGMDKRTFEAGHCKDKDPRQNIIAKYKQSITCSYTPSGLAYYQVSRLLGGAGRVPVSVLRTMDKSEHLKVTKRALALLSGSGDVIARTWGQVAEAHRANSRDVFSAEGDVYGFLAVNPQGEENYTEVSGVGDYDSRYQRFLQQPPFRRVSSGASVETLAGGADPKRLLPVVVQMKDVSDMVLMDTLLSQDDRIGNIHFKFRWYMLQDGRLVAQKSKAKRPAKGQAANYREAYEAMVPAEELAAMKAKGAFLVKEMLLKDNDCGVDVRKRDNQMRKILAVEKLRHMSGRTYAAFMGLARFIAQNPNDSRAYFQGDLLFTPADYETSGKSFLKNIEKARSVLLANCKAGTLKLDLDVEQYLPGAAPGTVPCEI